MSGSRALTECDPLGDDTEQLLRRGEHALLVRGDLGAARAWFDSAYRAAENRGDGTAMARAALGMGGIWAHEQRPAAEAEKARVRLTDALLKVDPQSPLGLRLRVRLVAEQDYLTGGYETTLELVAQAVRGGDPVAVAEALGRAQFCVMGPEHAALRLDLAREQLGAASRTGRRHDLLMGLMWSTLALFQNADPYAGRRLEELRDRLSQGEHLATGYVLSGIEVMLGIRAGRLAEAEEQAAVCAERGEAAGAPNTVGPYAAQLGAIRWYQGRIAELAPDLAKLVNSPLLSPADNSGHPALALAAAAAGDRRLAAGALARACGPGGGLARIPRSGTWLLSMYTAVEAAHLLGDAEMAGQAYDLLLPYAHLPVVVSLGFSCLGSVHHSLGVASLTVANAEKAVRHLRQAVRDNLALGHWPGVALSRARLGQALELLDGHGGDEALRESATAAQEAAALGMALPHQAPASPAHPSLSFSFSSFSSFSSTSVPSAARSEHDSKVTCSRSGKRWRIEHGGRTTLIDDSVGIRHLATLLAHPGREIRAIDLAAGPAPTAELSGSAQPLLDEEAKRRYKERLARLDDDIEEFEAQHDLARVAALRAERDWLIGELTAAAGLGGRTRHFGDNEERARVAVGKAIRRAVNRIAEADPALGAALRAGVHTGLRCCYRPG